MSTIKVDTIQSRQHSSSTISLTSTGATVNGDCTATTFSGSGASLTSLPAANLTGTLPALSAANLTSIPAANITGTLPAIDGSNLTGVGGGAYDFVSSQILTSTATYIDFNPTGGLSAGVYKIIGKNVYRPVNTDVEIQAYTNGGTSTVSNTWDYAIENWNYYDPFHYYQSQERLIISNHGQDVSFGTVNSIQMSADSFEIDFSTDYNSWIRGSSQSLGFNRGWVEFKGILNYTNHAYASNKVTGLRFLINNTAYDFQVGTEMFLYKLKES